MELHVYHGFFVGINMICLISVGKHRQTVVIHKNCPTEAVQMSTQSLFLYLFIFCPNHRCWILIRTISWR